METVDNQRRIWAVRRDCANIGLTHVAASCCDLTFLVIAHLGIKEFINGAATLSLTDPDNHRSIQVVDQCGVLMPLVVLNLINANALQGREFDGPSESA